MSWPAFRALPPDRLIAVLPLGALEAHGPHLPLGTDIVIAEAMARAGAERLARRGFDVVLLPALPVSPAPFAAAFAGTVDTPAAATTALISAVAESVRRHGGRATVIANAHHDPAHVGAIRAAVRTADMNRLATIVFPDLTRRRWASRLTDEFRSGACHAGRYEGSVVLAMEPGQVDTKLMASLPANPQSLVEAIERGDRTFATAGGPDAYFGWPAEATREEGREIIERLGAVLEEAVVEVITAANKERRTTDDERRAQNEEPAPDDALMTAATTGPLLQVVNPESLGRPSGFSHGVVAPAGWRSLYVAGETAADETGVIADAQFVPQFDIALGKVVAVVRAAGGNRDHIARMTIYVTDIDAYRANRALLADVWARHMGRHYPAMALVAVAGLVDRGAMVEIEADAVVPPDTTVRAIAESR